MKRMLCCLLVVVLTAAAVRAQEPVESELDFVRKLRARGYIDLAKEYLDKLQERKDPKLAAALPLEQARTILALAREKDAEQRFGLFGQVRALLQDYVKKNEEPIRSLHRAMNSKVKGGVAHFFLGVYLR